MTWKQEGSVAYNSSENVVFASAAKLASAIQTSPDIKLLPSMGRARGLFVIIDVTVNAGTAGSVQVNINFKDPASGKYILLLASATLSAVATIVLRISPELTASANLIAKDLIPETLQIVATGGNGGPITYSVGMVQAG